METKVKSSCETYVRARKNGRKVAREKKEGEVAKSGGGVRRSTEIENSVAL